MNADGIEIKDKAFEIETPLGIKDKQVLVGASFLHILTFNDNQKIVLIYFPDASKNDKIKTSENLSYNEFFKAYNKVGVWEEIADIPMSKERRFGIAKLKNLNFYTFYLNIKREALKEYNYAITSVAIPHRCA